MSFQDSAVIFFIALLLFGPKKLPELARQLGKLMGEFRRASNDFRMQMEDELRISEQAERQKQIAAIEASAPPTAGDLALTAAVPASEELEPHPHARLSGPAPDHDVLQNSSDPVPDHTIAPPEPPDRYRQEPEPAAELDPAAVPASAPLPIATSGDLVMMPPATGLPVGRSNSVAQAFDSIPAAPTPTETQTPSETPHHG